MQYRYSTSSIGHFPLMLAEARGNRDPPRAMFLTTPTEILVTHHVHTNPIILSPTLAQHVLYRTHPTIHRSPLNSS